MTSEDLAVALVAYFNGLAGKPLECEAANPESSESVQVENTDWNIFVLPYSESEQSFDRGDTCREELTCSVVVNGPIRAAELKDKGLELTKFLRNSLKATEFTGYVWDNNEVVSPYDADALKTKEQFLSLFRPTYYTFA